MNDIDRIVDQVSRQGDRDGDDSGTMIRNAARLAYRAGLEDAAKHIDVPWARTGAEFAAAIRAKLETPCKNT